MKPLAEFTLDDAIAEIEARKASLGEGGFDANRKLIEEQDFWQDGETWKGPRGTPAAWAASLKEAVANQHIPGAASFEALNNFLRGLFGKEANIQAVPVADDSVGDQGNSDEEVAEARQLVDFLTEWWDDVGLWGILREAGRRSRWAGWGDVRLWIPDGLLEDGGDGSTRLPIRDDFASALAAIRVSAPMPDSGISFRHPSTQSQASIFTYTDDDDNLKAELWYQDLEQLDENGKPLTVLVILSDEGREGPYEYEWGGRIPQAEIKGEVMITDVVRRQEAALNFAETNIVKIGETAGFRERYTGNAEPNGIWLTTRPTTLGPTREITLDDGSKLYFHPTPRSMGPSVTTDLVGIKIETSDEGERRATPSVTIAEPVDPAYGIAGAEYRRKRVLELCGQGHLAMIGSGESSGFAYEQSRAVFRGDLEWHKNPVEMAIASILETVIVMAESMMSSPPRYLERFRIVVTLTVDPGPVSPEYQNQVMVMVDKGLLSRPSAMSRLGVEDVQGEMDAIEQDPSAQVGRWKAIAEVLRELLPIEAISRYTAIRILLEAGFPIPTDEPNIEVDKIIEAELERIEEDTALPAGTPGSGLGNEGQIPPGEGDDDFELMIPGI